MADDTLTPAQRTTEFHKLWDRLPGRKIDKMRTVRDVLFTSATTIRIWRMKDTQRPIPEAKLRILQRHFTGQ